MSTSLESLKNVLRSLVNAEESAQFHTHGASVPNWKACADELHKAFNACPETDETMDLRLRINWAITAISNITQGRYFDTDWVAHKINMVIKIAHELHDKQQPAAKQPDNESPLRTLCNQAYAALHKFGSERLQSGAWIIAHNEIKDVAAMKEGRDENVLPETLIQAYLIDQGNNERQRQQRVARLREILALAVTDERFAEIEPDMLWRLLLEWADNVAHEDDDLQDTDFALDSFYRVHIAD